MLSPVVQLDRLKIELFRRAIGTLCLFIGADARRTHQFGSAQCRVIQPHFQTWGAGFLIAGRARCVWLLCSIAVHALVTAMLFLLAGGFAGVGVWNGRA
jgi:hypothetical protein